MAGRAGYLADLEHTLKAAHRDIRKRETLLAKALPFVRVCGACGLADAIEATLSFPSAKRRARTGR